MFLQQFFIQNVRFARRIFFPIPYADYMYVKIIQKVLKFLIIPTTFNLIFNFYPIPFEVVLLWYAQAVSSLKNVSEHILRYNLELKSLISPWKDFSCECLFDFRKWKNSPGGMSEEYLGCIYAKLLDSSSCCLYDRTLNIHYELFHCGQTKRSEGFPYLVGLAVFFSVLALQKTSFETIEPLFWCCSH